MKTLENKIWNVNSVRFKAFLKKIKLPKIIVSSTTLGDKLTTHTWLPLPVYLLRSDKIQIRD